MILVFDVPVTGCMYRTTFIHYYILTTPSASIGIYELGPNLQKIVTFVVSLS